MPSAGGALFCPFTSKMHRMFLFFTFYRLFSVFFYNFSVIP